MSSIANRLFAKLLPPRDLWRAAKLGDAAAIRNLATAGADVNAKRQSFSAEGDTPLHVAARCDQSEAVRVLLELGANPNSRNNAQTTPLQEGVAGNSSDETVDELLRNGAKIDAQNELGDTALDVAAFNGNERLVTLLLAEGANPNQGRGSKQSEVLANAIRSRSVKVFQLLLQAGAKPDAPGQRSPALVLAAGDGLDKFVEMLLQAGADPNVKDNGGFPAIMAAVRGKNLQVLEHLIGAGADVNCTDPAGETALDIAERSKRPEIAIVLLKAGAKRGSELMKLTPREATWQLRGCSDLRAWLDPWPTSPGRTCLNVAISSESSARSKWQMRYRIRSASHPPGKWCPLYPSTKDDCLFQDEINLGKGELNLDLEVMGPMQQAPDVLTDWEIEV